MSNKVIPKEQLSAYQRWELSALDEQHQRTVRQQETGTPEESGLVLPTAEELEQIHQQAYQEGYTAGYSEGRHQVEADAASFGQLLESVDEVLQDWDQEVARQVLELALEVARQVLRGALESEPDRVLGVVREAMNALPQAAHHPHLVLHPEDASLVRTHLETELAHGAWRIIEDATVTRGGCRIDTPQGEVDATLETRWKKIVSTLGSNQSWHEE